MSYPKPSARPYRLGIGHPLDALDTNNRAGAGQLPPPPPPPPPLAGGKAAPGPTPTLLAPTIHRGLAASGNLGPNRVRQWCLR